jgi:hypothetical protein
MWPIEKDFKFKGTLKATVVLLLFIINITGSVFSTFLNNGRLESILYAQNPRARLLIL